MNNFVNGCPGDTGRGKNNLMVTLVDFMDVTKEEVNIDRHGGVCCLCDLCKTLKKLEDS